MKKTLWLVPLAAIVLSGCAVRDYIRTLPCCETPPARCDVLFAYNKDAVGSGDLHKISAVARRLSADTGMSVRLEGHADERGGSAYNHDLAMRRSENVRKALIAKGARAGQIELVSYGEDQPVAAGSGEHVWAQNRCVNVVE